MSPEIEWQFDVADLPRVRSLLNSGRPAEGSLVPDGPNAGDAE